jgi:polyisoprenoid-binding protein YceI
MATTKWVLDPMHSEVQFKVKHLVISTVTGSFRKFEGEVVTESEETLRKNRATSTSNRQSFLMLPLILKLHSNLLH